MKKFDTCLYFDAAREQANFCKAMPRSNSNYQRYCTCGIIWDKTLLNNDFKLDIIASYCIVLLKLYSDLNMQYKIM